MSWCFKPSQPQRITSGLIIIQNRVGLATHPCLRPRGQLKKSVKSSFAHTHASTFSYIAVQLSLYVYLSYDLLLILHVSLVPSRRLEDCLFLCKNFRFVLLAFFLFLFRQCGIFTSALSVYLSVLWVMSTPGFTQLGARFLSFFFPAFFVKQVITSSISVCHFYPVFHALTC